MSFALSDFENKINQNPIYEGFSLLRRKGRQGIRGT